MMDWNSEIKVVNLLKSMKVDYLSKGYTEEQFEDLLIKAKKDITKLQKKEVWVERGGKKFKQTVYVKGEDEIGEQITPEVMGLDIVRYSAKAIAIKGDTYANKDLMREIKSNLGVGGWNAKLKAWIFPSKHKERVLGYIWSDVYDEEKKDAIQNQKNELFSKGDEINVSGEKGKVTKCVSDNEGIKYNITLDDGAKLEGVDEKTLNKEPELDDKKISEAINNTNESNRNVTEKKLYGIKPVEDIHKYSLQEYMSMHGLSQEDIDKAVNAFTKKTKVSDTPSSGGSGGSKSKPAKEGLTKRQLIGKLIYKHYKAVQDAIERGDELPEKAFELYEDLKQAYSKKRKEMTEETKRKISEALKKNKPDESPEEKKKKEEAEDQGVDIPDKENYKPKDGDTFKFFFKSFRGEKKEHSIKSKDYTDIPALDVSIPSKKDILDKPKPYFIPDIDDKIFRKNSYTLSAIKLDDDKYLVALDGYSVTENYQKNFNENGNFAVMNLDVLAATQNYYQLKAKEEYKASLYNRMIENRERRSKSLQENGMSKEEADKAAAELYDKPRRKRLKILSGNRMTYDQLYMIEGYYSAKGEDLSRSDVWRKYNEYKSGFDQKTLDIKLQQEHDASSFTKGRETSYGNIGTKDDLLNDYGIKVKRQNGDEIKEGEVLQIKEAMDNAAKVYGKNIQMNKEFGLKISHSGDVKMHAMKATGVFFPFYNAIGISNEYGEDMFNFVFGHEYAHFMDYWVGKKTGNHYASDKQGSTANKIASTFRKNMNKSQKSDYMNRTCECLARAMEQHVAIETKGENAIVWEREKYFKAGNYVNKDVYEKELKPLIKQFFEENKDLLKSLFN